MIEEGRKEKIKCIGKLFPFLLLSLVTFSLFPVQEAYRYRNYVIDSFNQDKPYDQMIREQIAVDLLALKGEREKYAERVIATGYITITRRFGYNPTVEYHVMLSDTIDTLGRSILGLAIGCARCHLGSPASVELQALELEMLGAFNRKHLQKRETDSGNLAARIKSFETAFGMQIAAPEVFDLSLETDATLRLYGLERGSTKGFAWQCLVARPLAERGVRFVELIDSGSSNNWDAHGDMASHVPLARNVDQPIAGLLKDLKSRGMLDETLVVWTTEFGRPPYDASPQGKGRGHQHLAFCSWLAGGGVKGGMVHGATDEYGLAVAEDPVHIHDFHATILHLLGLDHEKLTYHYAGRDFRLTDVHGNVIHKILRSRT